MGKGFFLLGAMEVLGDIQDICGIWGSLPLSRGDSGIGVENRWENYNLSMGRKREGLEEPLGLWDHLNPTFLG